MESVPDKICEILNIRRFVSELEGQNLIQD